MLCFILFLSLSFINEDNSIYQAVLPSLNEVSAHTQTLPVSTQETFPSAAATKMVTGPCYHRGCPWHEHPEVSVAGLHLWPCSGPMEVRKSFQLPPPIPLFLMQEQRAQLRVSANPPRSCPSVETLASAFHPPLLPWFPFFSGPDVDKLAASFLWALWRAKGYTLESLKPCHFHLEPVADLARQPGK